MCLLTFGDPIFSVPTITGENARETPEKQQRIRKNRAKKNWLSKERNTFKNRENIKQNRQARNICRKRKVSGQEGWNLCSFDSIAKLPHLYN